MDDAVSLGVRSHIVDATAHAGTSRNQMVQNESLTNGLGDTTNDVQFLGAHHSLTIEFVQFGSASEAKLTAFRG